MGGLPSFRLRLPALPFAPQAVVASRKEEANKDDDDGSRETELWLPSRVVHDCCRLPMLRVVHVAAYPTGSRRICQLARWYPTWPAYGELGSDAEKGIAARRVTGA